ncbi:MAG: DUF1015 family protein [Actinomycetota bacterium]
MVAVEPIALRVVRPEWAAEVLAPPHDALSPADRRRHLADYPHSYLGVTRSPEDIELGEFDPAIEAMRRSRASLVDLLTLGAFGPLQAPSLYLYRLEVPGHSQTGLVCGTATAAYDAGEVRIHEQIKQPRVDLLARHLAHVGAQSSPIAMAFHGAPAVEAVIARVTSATEPHLEVVDRDLRQTLWAVSDPGDVDVVRQALTDQPLYLIDGHHRAAAASAHQARAGVAGQLMLSVIFPFAELRNLAFHRILRGVDGEEVLSKVRERFVVRGVVTPEEVTNRPEGWMAMAVGGEQLRWYLVELPPPPPGDLDIDPVRLGRHVLEPILGIDEASADGSVIHQPGPGHADAVAALRLESDEVAFWMRPVAAEVLLDVADRGGTMPPKSTYFVPKVRSGLFVRLTDPALEAGSVTGDTDESEQ